MSIGMTRRQRRIDRRAGDGPMPEPALDRQGVVPLVGEDVAAGMAQMCRRALISKFATGGGPFAHAGERGHGESRAALADEDEG
jgi:hypothetical protein